MKVVTAQEMRRIDASAAADYALPSILLMENAGAQVARAAAEFVKGRFIVVLAGKGNNGGDGLVAARHLSNAGAVVKVYLFAEKSALRGDAAVNLGAAERWGIPVIEAGPGDLGDPAWAGDDAIRADLSRADLVIDALLGTGLKGPASGRLVEAIEMINACGRPVLAVDVPSGLDADTGQAPGPCVRASLTVTLGLPKVGLLLHPGVQYAGELRVADISLPHGAIEAQGIRLERTEGGWVRAILPRRRPDAHKGDSGHVFLLAGSVGMTGAPALASMAALRVGAGLVTLGLPASLNDPMEAKLTEVMTLPLPETPTRTLAAEAFDVVRPWLSRACCVAVGPGLGVNEDTVHLVRNLIVQSQVPVVIDADGLRCLAGRLGEFALDPAPAAPEPMPEPREPAPAARGFEGAPRERFVLTPHPGEMAALLSCTTAEVQADRIGIARRAAALSGAVVVLKGAPTVVAAPDGTAYLNPTGNPALATAGSGDVLTGIISGLIAQGLTPREAAVAGVYLHGVCGDLAAGPSPQRKGVSGTVAGDLVDLIPEALRELHFAPKY